MINTNIMTGHTHIATCNCIFAGVYLCWLKCPVAWGKALASPGVVMPLQIQWYAHKNITFSVIINILAS